MSDRDMRRIKGAMADNWDTLAQEAWAGFKRSGPGFVIVSNDSKRLEYVPVGPIPALELSDMDWGGILYTCGDYEPTEEVVLLFHGFAGRNVVVPVRQVTPIGMRTPPEAYETAMALFREALAAGDTDMDTFLKKGLPSRYWRKVDWRGGH